MRFKIRTLCLAIGLSLLEGLTGCQPIQMGGNTPRFEHFALNVPDPVAMADWYAVNLDMVIMRKGGAPENGRFVADAGKHVMLELYHNANVMVPDYPSIDWHVFHVAFVVHDVQAMRDRLLQAGATPCPDITVNTTDSGDVLTVVRDPWGVPLQFLKRADPMLKR